MGGGGSRGGPIFGCGLRAGNIRLSPAVAAILGFAFAAAFARAGAPPSEGPAEGKPKESSEETKPEPKTDPAAKGAEKAAEGGEEDVEGGEAGPPRLFFLEDGSARERVPKGNSRRGRKGGSSGPPEFEEVIHPMPEEPDPGAPKMADPVTGTPYESYGKVPTGGEGGKEAWVTSLSEGGAGSLAAVLSQNKENAIIKFKVSGTIRLGAPISIRAKNLTIAGETAGGGGVTLDGGGAAEGLLSIKGENIIVRRLRFRNAGSGCAVQGGRRILIDHCSAGWCASGAGGLKINSGEYVTISWCIAAGCVEAMRSHGVYASVHHNYWVANNRRNPKVMGPGAVWYDYRNNVVIHWQNYGVRVEGNSSGNIVNNVFGPTINPERTVQQALEYGPSAGPWHIAGNLAEGGDVNALSRADRPFAEPRVTTVPADQVLDLVKKNAGARPLDAFDQGYLDGSNKKVLSENYR